MITNDSGVPELRFPGFKGEWKWKQLGEITSTFKSGEGITSKDINVEGTYPVYGGNGLRGFTNTFTHDGFYVLIGRQAFIIVNEAIVPVIALTPLLLF